MHTTTKKILIHGGAFSLITSLFFASNVFAADATPIASGDYPNPIVGVDTIPAFLAKVLDGLSTLLIPIVVIYIIYAGYLFVTAQGEEAKIQKARHALMWTLIGAAVILGAKIMAGVLADTLGEFTGPA